jgi:6,7-dimethyl-8-ribityllumazine synthase
MEHEGDFDLDDARIAVVATRWNDVVVDRLVDGALSVLGDCGLDEGSIDVFRVPGAFELPVVCDRLADGGDYDGIVALGAVIRGETPHFDYICQETTRGLGAVALEYGLPVGFGLITADTVEQADARSQPDDDSNKGVEAASAVAEVISLLRQIEDDSGDS